MHDLLVTLITFFLVEPVQHEIASTLGCSRVSGVGSGARPARAHPDPGPVWYGIRRGRGDPCRSDDRRSPKTLVACVAHQSVDFLSCWSREAVGSGCVSFGSRVFIRRAVSGVCGPQQASSL